MALVFPASPVVGDRFPAGAGTPGVTQYEWTGSVWDVVSPFVRTNNQLSENGYVWPDTLTATPGFQLTDSLGDGVLSWGPPGGPFIYLDDISSQFNDTNTTFTLLRGGNPFTPDPDTNLIIVLGGVIQNPGGAYTVVGSTIIFSAAPATGATFIAISNLEC